MDQHDLTQPAFAIEQSVRQDCFLSPLLYVFALEPLLRRLRDRVANPALQGVPFAGCLRVKVSVYADITVFVSRRSYIKAVKKAVERCEEVAGAKINFDKSEGLRLGAWRDGVPLPGLFGWSNGLVHIRGGCFEPGIQLERNLSEVRVKVEAQVGTCFRRHLSLKGQVEVYAVFIFPLIL